MERPPRSLDASDLVVVEIPVIRVKKSLNNIKIDRYDTQRSYVAYIELILFTETLSWYAICNQCIKQTALSIMLTCSVVLTFESVDEILWCDHSNETSSAVLLHGTICFSIV